MIPATPSGSYFAEGLVMISMVSMLLAGICCRASEPCKMLGRPSMSTVNEELPRKLTLPSMSTWTEGVFSKAVTAEPPCAMMS